MEQKIFYICDYPRDAVESITFDIIKKGWRVVTITSTVNGTNMHMIDVIVAAERPKELAKYEMVSYCKSQ